ncbi:uncharacterized protein LOC117345295 [Pecten maximus]|uniref:uncharacterized protein LOC117345295 n=1 Tax=Pecten maximus TaxID=6579 RepID=UPI001458AF36|nr:uncharacterized protein LOC117345295 [Pecten maximus]
MVIKCKVGVWILLVLCTASTEQSKAAYGVKNSHVPIIKDSPSHKTANTSNNKSPPLQSTNDPGNLNAPAVSRSPSAYNTTEPDIHLFKKQVTGRPPSYTTGSTPVYSTGSSTVYSSGRPKVYKTGSQQLYNTGSPQVQGTRRQPNQNSPVPCTEDKKVHKKVPEKVEEKVHRLRNPLHSNIRIPIVHNITHTSKGGRNQTREFITRKILKKKMTGTQYTGVYLIPDMLCSLCSRQSERRGRRQRCKKMFCYK